MTLQTAHSIFLDYYEIDSYSFTTRSKNLGKLNEGDTNQNRKKSEKNNLENEEENCFENTINDNENSEVSKKQRKENEEKSNKNLESSNSISENDSQSLNKSEDNDSSSEEYSFSAKRRSSGSPSFEDEKKSNNNYYVNIIFIQMEYCKELTLNDYISKTNLLALDEKWRILKEILEGMLYFHTYKIEHRDIKPANIFLDKKKRVKIGDFGIAYRQNSSQMNSNIKDSDHVKTVILNYDSDDKKEGSSSEELGTALYRSPEQEKKGVIHTCKSDIYSLGIVMYELWNPPFSTKMERVVNLSKIKKENKLPQEFIDNPENEMITSLINQCIKINPEERPSAKQLLEM